MPPINIHLLHIHKRQRLTPLPFLYLFQYHFPTTSLPLPNTPTPAQCFICCSNNSPNLPLQPSLHSLHHLFISNPATVPSPFGEGHGSMRWAPKRKEPRSLVTAGLSLEKRRLPTLPHCIAVPSAQAGLTSLFGMGRGGTPPL